MYVWSKEGQTEWVIHDGKRVVSYSSGADLGEFYLSQQESQVKYDEVVEGVQGGVREDFGVKVGTTYITSNGGQLVIVYQVGAQDGLHESVQELVSAINKKYEQVTLTCDEIAQIEALMGNDVPEEYLEATTQILAGVVYKTDLHLVYDVLSILNKWVERDGFEGHINYTEDGLQVDFGLEHPIMIHLGGYGRFSHLVDQTFITCVKEGDRLYNKVEQLFKGILDFYKWLNPINLSYQTNKILGDDRIKVTLKDPRVVEYQRQIREDFQVFQKGCREVKHIELKFSHTTLSVYANIEFFKEVPKMRLSVRDHDNCYEEGIHIIRVNTLKAMNVVERLKETVGAYIEQQTKGWLHEQGNNKKGVVTLSS